MDCTSPKITAFVTIAPVLKSRYLNPEHPMRVFSLTRRGLEVLIFLVPASLRFGTSASLLLFLAAANNQHHWGLYTTTFANKKVSWTGSTNIQIFCISFSKHLRNCSINQRHYSSASKHPRLLIYAAQQRISEHESRKSTVYKTLYIRLNSSSTLPTIITSTSIYQISLRLSFAPANIFATLWRPHDLYDDLYRYQRHTRHVSIWYREV